MINNNISIVLISDNNYAIPARVVCNSIIRNNTQNNKIEINIIGIEFSQENLEKFQQLDTELVVIKVIQTQNSLAHIANNHPHVSKAALQKFMIPEYFSNMDKILYLDCDVLVCEDLTELFTMNISTNYAAVVKDMAGTISENHHIKMNHKDYFNSGMMLLNLKKIREDNVVKKMIEVKASKQFTHFMDQDEFNYVFAENVTYLSPKYNFMSPNLNYDFLDIASFYSLTLDELQQIYKQPTIIHLTNYPKTWNDIDNINFKMWFNYIAKEDNYDLVLYHHNKYKEQILEMYKKEAQANTRASQAEQSANESKIRAEIAEQNAQNAWQHYHMIENSNSWKITKPLRLLGKFSRWFVSGSYHWLTFSPTSRPRRVLKRKLIELKHYINARPKFKYKIINILNKFPTLQARLKRIGNTEYECSIIQGSKIEIQNLEFMHLSPQAKKIYNDLKYIIEQRKNEIQK